MSVTDAGQYRKTRTKLITLPSTLEDGSHPVFRIRRPGAKALMRLYAQLSIESTAGLSREEAVEKSKEYFKTQEGREQIIQFLDGILTSCVVEPKIVVGEPKENALSIDELDIEDQMFILEEILKFAGITEEKAKEREFFR